MLAPLMPDKEPDQFLRWLEASQSPLRATFLWDLWTIVVL